MNAINSPDITCAPLKVGQRVTYITDWGTGDRVPGTITGEGEHKGRKVYDVELNGVSRWGYANQFEPLDDTGD